MKRRCEKRFSLTSAPLPGFLLCSCRGRSSDQKKKTFWESVSYFSVTKRDALRKRRRHFGAAVQLRILQPNGLSPELWCLLASPHRCWAPLGLQCLLPFPAAVQKSPVPEGALVSACSAGAPTALCFMHHRFNKHRQHPRRSPLPILPAEGTKLFPLLSSPPNPRLYQLSIKKIQLQFGIRLNTLITKGWCNLITWYLFRGLSRGLASREERKKKKTNVGEMSE